MVIYWLRQDLRLLDNQALTYALENKQVLPIYIDDQNDNQINKMGEASKVWLYYTLKLLNESFYQQISFYQGDPLSIIKRLIDQYQITKIYWNRCYEPWQIKRDQQIKSELTKIGVEVKTFGGFLLWEPWEVLKKDQSPYRVFTAFYQKGCLQKPPPKAMLKSPMLKKENLFLDKKNGLSLDQLSLLPKINWYQKIINNWHIGEKKALARLNYFLENHLSDYKKSRDFPALDATSKLSQALHFGEISPKTIWHLIHNFQDSDGKAHFLRELMWREFSYHLLFYFNELPNQNWQQKFNHFPWINDNVLLTAWQKGQTGIPIVDAGMRQLWQTGSMHNRVRMICASFLTKNCLIDWRLGAEWFWQCLFDADLANNSASWQWVAGSGFDAAPYFRIFNPILQAEKFDPDGIYIRIFIPELKHLPTKFIFAPWLAPKALLNELDIHLGQTYPYPIVDLKQSREKALELYKGVSNE